MLVEDLLVENVGITLQLILALHANTRIGFCCMVDPLQVNYLVPLERVFGVSINGDTRAYPARFLDWHEMFNDVVGGQPVSFAY